MEKFKTYGLFSLGLISVFLIGTYADATLFGTREIQLHQWGLTSLFGLVFLECF